MRHWGCSNAAAVPEATHPLTRRLHDSRPPLLSSCRRPPPPPSPREGVSHLVRPAPIVPVDERRGRLLRIVVISPFRRRHRQPPPPLLSPNAIVPPPSPSPISTLADAIAADAIHRLSIASLSIDRTSGDDVYCQQETAAAAAVAAVAVDKLEGPRPPTRDYGDETQQQETAVTSWHPKSEFSRRQVRALATSPPKHSFRAESFGGGC